jgi:hypothetical protein
MEYNQTVLKELEAWKIKVAKQPGIFDKLSKRLQVKINSYIPNKVHNAITTAIKQMIRGVLFSAKYVTKKPVVVTTLQQTEEDVQKVINGYRTAAAAEGGVIGAGGFLLGLAELPILMSIKIKMLFDIAALYGYSVHDYKERIYILHVFQLAFSSQKHRREVYAQMTNWEAQKQKLPDDIHQFNWLHFQQEYRDYIDLAKLAQLIPGIGAVVGIVVNYRLLKKLGITAMNAYRMRWFDEQRLLIER